MTHTPGPWVLDEKLSGSENHRGFDIWSDPKRHRVVGDVYPIDSDGIEGRANARLISAAPDLLAALQLVEKGLRSKHIKDQSLVRGEEVIALSSIVRNAIARATS